MKPDVHYHLCCRPLIAKPRYCRYSSSQKRHLSRQDGLIKVGLCLSILFLRPVAQPTAEPLFCEAFQGVGLRSFLKLSNHCLHHLSSERKRAKRLFGFLALRERPCQAGMHLLKDGPTTNPRPVMHKCAKLTRRFPF